MSALKKPKELIDLGFVTIELIRPNIACVNVQNDEIVSVEKGIKILETYKPMIGDIKHATLVNLAGFYPPIKEFYKFILSQRTIEKDNLVARAVVSTNVATRIEWQNFINTYKPLTPTKLFSTIDEAITWIEPQLNR